MRWVGEALRGAWTALAAHPIVFASVTLAVAALNVVAPVAILSAVRKPFDFYTFNPWLKRLPEYFASDDAPLVEKLAKLPALALFWVSAGSTYGGAARELHRGGLAGAAATVFGVSTGACSVTGCGAESSRVATIALLVVLVLAAGYLGAVHALQEKMAENDCPELEARHDRIA